jgi:hypothetical protein
MFKIFLFITKLVKIFTKAYKVTICFIYIHIDLHYCIFFGRINQALASRSLRGAPTIAPSFAQILTANMIQNKIELL